MSILGMLSHYRSGESQLRELLRLAPPTGVSQTKADFGFSWGGGGGRRGEVRGGLVTICMITLYTGFITKVTSSEVRNFLV